MVTSLFGGRLLARRRGTDVAEVASETSRVVARARPAGNGAGTLPLRGAYFAHPAPRRITLMRVLFFLIALLPTAAGVVYYGAIAVNRFVSTAEMTIVTSGTSGTTMTTAASVFGGTVGGGSSNSTITNTLILMSAVQDYVQSHNIVEDLQRKLDLRKMWSTERADPLYRLRPDASDEDLYEYYLSRIYVSLNSSTGLITLTVEAFTPQEAKTIAAAILDESDKMVERLDSKTRHDLVAFAENEVKHYRITLENARLGSEKFRNEHAEINTGTAAKSITDIVAGIEQQLAANRATLSSLLDVTGPRAPAVVNIKSQIRALEQQLEAEKIRVGAVAGSSKDKTYANLLTEYNRLQMEEGFAGTAYTSALTDLVVARAQASHKTNYLVPFMQPQLPHACTRWYAISCESLQPDRPLMMGTIAFFSFLTFGIVALILAAIHEHART